jgi:endonuclease V-like protein UPF0215 family
MEDVGSGKIAMEARKPTKEARNLLRKHREQKGKQTKILKLVIEIKKTTNNQQRIYKRKVPVEKGNV